MKNSMAPKLGTPHAEPHTVLHTESPIGLILCAESSREQVELLKMHKDGITVAEYWTELPPKAERANKATGGTSLHWAEACVGFYETNVQRFLNF
jgi:hypothetical protein